MKWDFLNNSKTCNQSVSDGVPSIERPRREGNAHDATSWRNLTQDSVHPREAFSCRPEELRNYERNAEAWKTARDMMRKLFQSTLLMVTGGWWPMENNDRLVVITGATQTKKCRLFATLLDGGFKPTRRPPIFDFRPFLPCTNPAPTVRCRVFKSCIQHESTDLLKGHFLKYVLPNVVST